MSARFQHRSSRSSTQSTATSPPQGGYPVIEDGMVLGGIGISGANQEIDADIAEAMLAAIA